MIMPYVFRAELSIFSALIPIDQIERLNLTVNAGAMTLTMLLKLIKALISSA